MSTEYEKIRERIMVIGGADIGMGWNIPSIRNPHYFEIVHKPYARHAPLPFHAKKTKPQVFTFPANIRDEIISCQALLNLAIAQKDSLNQIKEAKQPRSEAYEYWFSIADKTVSQREDTMREHLLSLEREYSGMVENDDVINIEPIRASLLESTVKHILYEDIAPQSVSNAELVNIIEDSTYYISFVEQAPLQFDEKNSVFVNYLKRHFQLLIRDDYCCGNCDSDLFVGIPYCLCCNTALKR